MGTVLLLILSTGVGAGLAYALDPDRGRRRRAVARDKVISAAHSAGDALDTVSRDVRHRTRGVIAGIRSRLSREEVGDDVLAERVRARIGGLLSHPGAVEVSAHGGRITLRGPVLADEVDGLVKRVASVRGVRAVDNQIDVHDEPGTIPGLQGMPARRRGGERFEFLQSHWSPTARLLAGLAGGALGIWGVRQTGAAGVAAGAAGLALLARAATDLEFRRLLGVGAGRRGITIQKTLVVGAPLAEVFEFWSRFENFPRFMAHVKDVRRTSDRRSHWTVAGPGGVPIEWETEVTRLVPNRVLAWKTVAGSAVGHAGTIHFEPMADGSTRLDIKMSYNPPGGALGHGVAALTGSDPRSRMDEDLVRFKSLVEEGRTRAHGGRVTRDELG